MRTTQTTNVQNTKVFDENQQRKVIKDLRNQAASFDRILRFAFLVISVLMIGVTIFVVGRVEEGNVVNKLKTPSGGGNGLSSSSSTSSVAVLMKWIGHIATIIVTLIGTITVFRFNPEKDWLSELSSSSKSKNHNSIFKNRYLCAMLIGIILVVQFLLDEDFFPQKNNFDFHIFFHRFVSPILGLAHSLCFPYLLSMMSVTQRELDLLEKKKYNISEA